MNTLTITKQTMFRQFEFIAALVEQGDVIFSYESAGSDTVSTGGYTKAPFGAKRFEGQRKTYSSERQKTYGDKPSFGDRAPRSERKSFGDKPAYSTDRPSYEKKSFGDKPAYNSDKPMGEKKSFRDKKPYGPKKVYSK